MYREVVELPTFLKQARSLLSDDEIEDLKFEVSTNPEMGDLVPGTGGVRKARFGRNDSGKSSGVRYLYYYWDDDVPLFLLTIYAKAKKETLTHDEKATLKKLSKQLLKEYGKE